MSPGPERMSPGVRLLLPIVLVPYVGWLIVAYRYHFLDGVNLLIHEAGHVVFSPLGDTAMLLGGTVLQLAVPAAFAASFLGRGMTLEGAVCGVWGAESLMYTATYLGDARAMALPLIGERHDWNALLGRWGLLGQAEPVGTALHWTAAGLALFCLAVIIRLALQEPRRGDRGEPAPSGRDPGG